MYAKGNNSAAFFLDLPNPHRKSIIVGRDIRVVFTTSLERSSPNKYLAIYVPVALRYACRSFLMHNDLYCPISRKSGMD
jgi:hypothetical protein